MIVYDNNKHQEFHFSNNDIAHAFGAVVAYRRNELDEWSNSKNVYADLVREDIEFDTHAWYYQNFRIPFTTIEEFPVTLGQFLTMRNTNMNIKGVHSIAQIRIYLSNKIDSASDYSPGMENRVMDAFCEWLITVDDECSPEEIDVHDALQSFVDGVSASEYAANLVKNGEVA